MLPFYTRTTSSYRLMNQGVVAGCWGKRGMPGDFVDYPAGLRFTSEYQSPELVGGPGGEHLEAHHASS